MIGSLLGELFLHYCLLTVDESPSPALSLALFLSPLTAKLHAEGGLYHVCLHWNMNDGIVLKLKSPVREEGFCLREAVSKTSSVDAAEGDRWISNEVRWGFWVDGEEGGGLANYAWWSTMDGWMFKWNSIQHNLYCLLLFFFHRLAFAWWHFSHCGFFPPINMLCSQCQSSAEITILKRHLKP